MSGPSVSITVSKDSFRCLGNDATAPNWQAEHGFSATLRNSGDLSLYDAKILLKCNYPIDAGEHDADFVLHQAGTNLASFCATCPLHPGEPARQMSWLVKGPAYLQWATDPTITLEFQLFARDRQPVKLVAEFGESDNPPVTKEAVPVQQE